MQKVPLFLCSAILATCAAGGCGGRQPETGEIPEISAEPATLPTTAPTEAARVIAPPVVILPVEPSPPPATEPASPATTAPLTTPTIEPIPVAQPATLPATTPAVRTADVAELFGRGLADIASGHIVGGSFALEGVSSREQRTLLAVLRGIADFDEQLAKRPSNEAVVAIVEMADRIRAVAPLEIPRVALSTKVEGFGVYDAIEPRFLAGREFSVAVYCELAGFSSRMGDRAMWETRLNQEIRLANAAGAVVWHDKPSTVVDVCRNRRRDFFVGRVIRLPASLPAGKYVLTTSITDQYSQEVAEGATELELVAPEQP